MDRKAWHLISTGHRPKDGADVICLFYSGEAIECHYDKEFDDFISYDQEWDMQPFHSDWFKAWCFDNDSQVDTFNAYDDFMEFSKEYGFPELLKSKKKQYLYKDTKITWDAFCKKCSLVHYRLQDNDPLECRKCAACGNVLPVGYECILSCESEKVWCGSQCVMHYYNAREA